MRNYLKIPLIGMILIMMGCSSDSENSSSNETGRLKVKFISTDSLQNTVTQSPTRLKAPAILPSWYNHTLVSDFAQTAGKPEEFKFKFVNIDLNPLNDEDGVLNIFNDSLGKEISITSTKVDISNLFQNTLGEDVFCFDDNDEEIYCQDENGTENKEISYVEYKIKTGTYNQIRTELKSKAQIKGCLTQSYSDNTLTPGTHTYCTQTSNSIFNSYGQNRDFENMTSEFTDIDLWGTAAPERDDFLADYGIPGNITISTDEKATLTLLIDTNRAMRFYNQANGIDDGEAPSGITDKSYFFSSKIDHDMFIFVGEPGKIEGYSYYAKECTMDGGRISDIPDDRFCDQNSSNFDSMIKGWVTLVYDKNNNPLMTNVKSDYHHGNIKGNNLKGSGEDTYHDTTAFETNDDNTINISTLYGDENPTSLTIENFQNIEAGNGFETTFTTHNDGFNFVGWGNIYFIREF